VLHTTESEDMNRNHDYYYTDIKKNGVPLTDTDYRLGSLQKMTKNQLIEEILGTHDWDYLLENGMVVEVTV